MAGGQWLSVEKSRYKVWETEICFLLYGLTAIGKNSNYTPHKEFASWEIPHTITPFVLFLRNKCVSMIWEMVRVAIYLSIFNCLAIN